MSSEEKGWRAWEDWVGVLTPKSPNSEASAASSCHWLCREQERIKEIEEQFAQYDALPKLSQSRTKGQHAGYESAFPPFREVITEPQSPSSRSPSPRPNSSVSQTSSSWMASHSATKNEKSPRSLRSASTATRGEQPEYESLEDGAFLNALKFLKKQRQQNRDVDGTPASPSGPEAETISVESSFPVEMKREEGQRRAQEKESARDREAWKFTEERGEEETLHGVHRGERRGGNLLLEEAAKRQERGERDEIMRPNSGSEMRTGSERVDGKDGVLSNLEKLGRSIYHEIGVSLSLSSLSSAGASLIAGKAEVTESEQTIKTENIQEDISACLKKLEALEEADSKQGSEKRQKLLARRAAASKDVSLQMVQSAIDTSVEEFGNGKTGQPVEEANFSKVDAEEVKLSGPSLPQCHSSPQLMGAHSCSSSNWRSESLPTPSFRRQGARSCSPAHTVVHSSSAISLSSLKDDVTLLHGSPFRSPRSPSGSSSTYPPLTPRSMSTRSPQRPSILSRQIRAHAQSIVGSDSLHLLSSEERGRFRERASEGGRDVARTDREHLSISDLEETGRNCGHATGNIHKIQEPEKAIGPEENVRDGQDGGMEKQMEQANHDRTTRGVEKEKPRVAAEQTEKQMISWWEGGDTASGRERCLEWTQTHDEGDGFSEGDEQPAERSWWEGGSPDAQEQTRIHLSSQLTECSIDLRKSQLENLELRNLINHERAKYKSLANAQEQTQTQLSSQLTEYSIDLRRSQVENLELRSMIENQRAKQKSVEHETLRLRGEVCLTEQIIQSLLCFFLARRQRQLRLFVMRAWAYCTLQLRTKPHKQLCQYLSLKLKMMTSSLIRKMFQRHLRTAFLLFRMKADSLQRRRIRAVKAARKGGRRRLLRAWRWYQEAVSLRALKRISVIKRMSRFDRQVWRRILREWHKYASEGRLLHYKMEYERVSKLVLQERNSLDMHREHLHQQWSAAETNWRTQREVLVHKHDVLEKRLEVEQERLAETRRELSSKAEQHLEYIELEYKAFQEHSHTAQQEWQQRILLTRLLRVKLHIKIRCFQVLKSTFMLNKKTRRKVAKKTLRRAFAGFWRGINLIRAQITSQGVEDLRKQLCLSKELLLSAFESHLEAEEEQELSDDQENEQGGECEVSDMMDNNRCGRGGIRVLDERDAVKTSSSRSSMYGELSCIHHSEGNCSSGEQERMESVSTAMPPGSDSQSINLNSSLMQHLHEDKTSLQRMETLTKTPDRSVDSSEHRWEIMLESPETTPRRVRSGNRDCEISHFSSLLSLLDLGPDDDDARGQVDCMIGKAEIGTEMGQEESPEEFDEDEETDDQRQKRQISRAQEKREREIKKERLAENIKTRSKGDQDQEDGLRYSEVNLDAKVAQRFLEHTMDVDENAELTFDEVLPSMLQSGFSHGQCLEIFEEMRNEGRDYQQERMTNRDSPTTSWSPEAHVQVDEELSSSFSCWNDAGDEGREGSGDLGEAAIVEDSWRRQTRLLNAVLESARVGALEEYQDNTATIPPTSPTKRTPSPAPVNKAHADQSTNERRESTGLHDILESHHENSVGSPNNDCEEFLLLEAVSLEDHASDLFLGGYSQKENSRFSFGSAGGTPMATIPEDSEDNGEIIF